jgi:hypothetical protein
LPGIRYSQVFGTLKIALWEVEQWESRREQVSMKVLWGLPRRLLMQANSISAITVLRLNFEVSTACDGTFEDIS